MEAGWIIIELGILSKYSLGDKTDRYEDTSRVSMLEVWGYLMILREMIVWTTGCLLAFYKCVFLGVGFLKFNCLIGMFFET